RDLWRAGCGESRTSGSEERHGETPRRNPGNAPHADSYWADGGATSIENCVLLCETHHRHVHCTGWEILIHPDHTEFIPPAILDPTRTPLHNPLRC
ncbi:MAG: hypothetical protein ACRDRS_03295, partial [Pseudonocardiaceae bacterium]